MEDGGIITDASRDISVAHSDSRNASEESTRASTPTEIRIEDAPADIGSLKPLEQEDVSDDVTMRDTKPEKKLMAGTTDELRNPEVVSWPSSTVIDPGTWPWKARKTGQEPVDYASDPQKLEELFRLNESDSPDLYKP